MKNKLKMLLTTVLLLASFTTVYTEGFEEEEVSVTNVKVREEYKEVKKGDVKEVEFEYEVEIDHSKFDGFKYLKYENGIHYFEATKDMSTAYIELSVDKTSGTEVETEEEGEGQDHGEPGVPDGTQGPTEWDSVDLGKHGWDEIDSIRQYAIRIEASLYNRPKVIYVRDLSENLKLIEYDGRDKVSLRRLKKESDGTISEEVEDMELIPVYEEDGEFVVKIDIRDSDIVNNVRYDIVYFMEKIDPDLGISNKYQVLTESEWEEIETGGEGGGTTFPDEEEEEEKVEEEEVSEEEVPEEEEVIEEEVSEEVEKEVEVEKEEVVEEDVEVVEKEVKEKDAEEKPVKDIPAEEEEEKVEDMPVTAKVKTKPLEEPLPKNGPDVLPPTGKDNFKTDLGIVLVALGIVAFVSRKRK